MKNYFFNRFFVLFFVVALLQLTGPICNLGFSFMKIPMVFWVNVLSQPAEIKLIIKKIATSGVLVLLSLFTFAYLYIILITSEKLKPFIWGALVFICIGSLGYYCKNQTKLDFRESNHKFISVDPAQGRVIISINFKKFPEAFYKDLNDSKKGNVKLYANQRFYFPLTATKINITLNKKKFPFATPILLNCSEVSAFIRDKKLSFELQGDIAALELRDLKGGHLISREDSLKVGDKKIELDYEKAFFISFYVESLAGKVLRVYS